jgi:hypothetical protein
MQTSTRLGETWHSDYFDVTWSDSSYLKNRNSYPQYNYTLLEKSQTNQIPITFDGPLPHDRRK